MGTEHQKSGIGNRFPRKLRLKRQRLIRALFDRSRTDTATVTAGTIRLLYRLVPRDEVNEDVPLKVGIAPGRRLRNAVERNRVKRVMREAYRQHQHLLVEAVDGCPDVLTLMILYRGAPPPVSEAISHDVAEALHRLARRLKE